MVVIRHGSCARGGGRASWDICPCSSGGICPGSRQEPGPMLLTPGPQPLVPVCGSTRDERLSISTGSCHKPGLTIWLYKPLAIEQSIPLVLCFFEEGKGGRSGTLAPLQCT